MNAYREFSASTSNTDIERSLKGCQQELHGWGAANQVAFDAGKESLHILSLSEPSGTGLERKKDLNTKEYYGNLDKMIFCKVFVNQRPVWESPMSPAVPNLFAVFVSGG